MPHALPDGRLVLITGASGVVGAALVDQLRDQPVVCLTHRQPVPGRAQVRGDLTAPLLGLGRAGYRSIAARVGAIVHCAAVTDFGAGNAATRSLNVQGTERVLALARDAGAVLHHLSTAFVSRQDIAGRLPGAGSPAHYLDSKRAAEAVVLDSGHPCTVIRPSVVIGDSRTGQIARFQGLHTIAGGVMRNTLPMVPLDPQARVDFVPQDLVARAVAQIVSSGASSGQYWLTAGDAALTAGRMVDLAVETGRRAGLPVARPRLVDPDMVDRLVRPVFIDPLPDRDRRRVEGLLAMASLFGAPAPFPSSLDRLPGVGLPTAAELEDAFAASLLHYVDVKRLRERRAA